jgi:hypothetical protein
LPEVHENGPLLCCYHYSNVATQANVLRFHTFGASGKDALALAAAEKLSDKPWFISDELMNELHRRYTLKEEPRHDDDWVVEQESNMFAFDPNQQMPSSALRAA